MGIESKFSVVGDLIAGLRPQVDVGFELCLRVVERIEILAPTPELYGDEFVCPVRALVGGDMFTRKKPAVTSPAIFLTIFFIAERVGGFLGLREFLGSFFGEFLGEFLGETKLEARAEVVGSVVDHLGL